MKDTNCFKKMCKEVCPSSFDSLALDIFRYQAYNNTLYGKYISNLGLNPFEISHINQIPFMPIDFFKTGTVKSGKWKEKDRFLSSGTASAIRSVHLIEDVNYYLQNTVQVFEQLYQPVNDVIFFALLPSYQEQGNSSLVRMVDYFIEQSEVSGHGGFFLNDLSGLVQSLKLALKDKSTHKKVCLFGVGYALLDLMAYVEDSGFNWSGLSIIETGGMKGRRGDMVKEEFYMEIRQVMPGVSIDSEYGMTELLSQAYAIGNAVYQLPKQMKVLVRDVNDPFQMIEKGRVGGLNIIDLANIHSCAFIETKDLGRRISDSSFELLGRIDNSDIRGCNLMIV